VLAPESDIKLTRLKVLTFPFPTTWRPEQMAYIEIKKLCHCHPMYTVIHSRLQRISDLKC